MSTRCVRAANESPPNGLISTSGTWSRSASRIEADRIASPARARCARRAATFTVSPTRVGPPLPLASSPTRLQEINDFGPHSLVGNALERLHVVVRYHRLGILDELIERRLIPGDS
jgi:hypothetical protein